METLISFMYVKFSGENTCWEVDFDDDLIDELSQKDWVEFTRETKEGKLTHRLYNPVSGPIEYISWTEK